MRDGPSVMRGQMWRRRGQIGMIMGVLALMACADRSGVQRQAGTPRAQQLAGTWEIRLHLERPLVFRIPSSRDVRAEVALLPNPWLLDTYSEITAPTNYGTYNADLSAFGFDPRDVGQIPLAIATVDSGNAVTVVLAPGRSATVILRGTMVGDSVRGVWEASVFHFGCGGRFTMTRMVNHSH